MTDRPTGWATPEREHRERTCRARLPPLFAVAHRFETTRDGGTVDPTVVRTHEVTVEWTTDQSLPTWLSTVAGVFDPFDADRFGDGGGDPAGDGRFRAAPADATVHPGGAGPGLADAYHYRNATVQRVREDANYPGRVTGMTVDLPDCRARWTADAPVTDPGGAASDLETTDARAGGTDASGTDASGTDASGTGASGTDASDGDTPLDRAGLRRRTRQRLVDDGGWRVDAEDDPATGGLGPVVEASLAPSVAEGGHDPEAALSAIAEAVEAAWRAFRWSGDGDPLAVPDAAVAVATGERDG